MFNSYKKLLYYVPKKKYLAYLGILFSGISAILTVFAYYYMYEFLKKLIILNEVQGAFYSAISIAGLLIIGSIIYMFSVVLTHILGFRLETNLRKKGIDGLMNASFKFFDLNSSGRTRQLIDDNASLTHGIIAHLIPDNTGAVLTPILVIILGFIINMKLGVVLLLFAILGAIQIMLMTGNKRFMEIYQNALEKMNSETVEYVRGMQVIKIFGASVNSFKSLNRAIIDYSDYALNYSLSFRKPYLRFQVIFLGALGIVLPFIVLFSDINKDPRFLVINLIMFLFLSGVLFNSFMKSMHISMYAFQGVTAVEKLEEIFESMQRDKLNFGTLERFKNFDIEFENVSFKYEDDKILDNLSFKLKANRSYALVGVSGSGKSTIAKLISGFYQINSGNIKIGGESILNYSEEAITKNIAFVFQDSKLFKMSIFDNVQIGNPNSTREEVFKALHLAGCDELIEKFPLKEKTLIGSKGVFLSGGERQRIAIARGILKNSNIIIMDEASAAIDPENEHELQRAFKNLIRGKTVIMIAHRLSSIKAVDEIIVMENGKIIERGTDIQLMNKNSRYRYFQELYTKANNWRVGYEKFI